MIDDYPDLQEIAMKEFQERGDITDSTLYMIGLSFEDPEKNDSTIEMLKRIIRITVDLSFMSGIRVGHMAGWYDVDIKEIYDLYGWVPEEFKRVYKGLAIIEGGKSGDDNNE